MAVLDRGVRGIGTYLQGALDTVGFARFIGKVRPWNIGIYDFATGLGVSVYLYLNPRVTLPVFIFAFVFFREVSLAHALHILGDLGAGAGHFIRRFCLITMPVLEFTAVLVVLFFLPEPRHFPVHNSFGYLTGNTHFFEFSRYTSARHLWVGTHILVGGRPEEGNRRQCGKAHNIGVAAAHTPPENALCGTISKLVLFPGPHVVEGALRMHERVAYPLFLRHAVRHLPVLSEPDAVEQSLRGFFCLMVAFRAGVYCTGGCLQLNGPLPQRRCGRSGYDRGLPPVLVGAEKKHELRRDTAHRQG